jgi:hypothetical protein
MQADCTAAEAPASLANGDGYPSVRPIGQVGITRLVRWSDPHNISISKRI